MGVYTSLQKSAIRLIAKYGMTVTFQDPTAGAPTVPIEEWKPTANSIVSTNVKMAFLPEETINFYTQFRSLIAKEDYQVGYEYALLGNNNFEPRLDMVVLKAGVPSRVKYVLNYAPAGDTVLYVVGLKI